MLSKLKESSYSTLLILLIIFTLLSIGILYPILSLILFGAMIAYIVRPVARIITPYVKYESLAILIAMFILGLPIVILLYFTVNQILLIAHNAVGQVPTYFNSTAPATTTNSSLINANVQNLGPLNKIADTIITEIGKLITQLITYIAEQITALIAYLPTFFTEMIILFFSIFYFAKEGDNFVEFIKDFLPKEKYFHKLYRQVDDILRSIMIVNIICATILGLLSVILYYILGYPYVLLLGIITAISEFFPVVGPWIVYATLGVFDILTGNVITGVIVILVGWLIDTFVDLYLRPRLAGKYTGVHPLVYLVGFIFGAIILGLPGLFIGPLIVGTAYVIYHAYRDEKSKTTTTK